MNMLTKLEGQRAEMLEMIQNWTAARLAYRPAPEAWSATEVLDHIVKVETEILAAARRGLREPRALGLQDRVRFVLLEFLFRSRTRVKVPTSAPQVLPDSSVELDTILENWDVTRRDLAELLAQLTPQQLAEGIFRHPVSGWMSMQHILRFFSVHIHHHMFQLIRLRDVSERLAA